MVQWGLREAVEGLEKHRSAASCGVYASLLRRCAAAGALDEGRQLHRLLAQQGRWDTDRFIGNLLVQMYGSCGSVAEADSAFEATRARNVFSWNILLTAYARNGEVRAARRCLDRMPHRDVYSWTVVIASLAAAHCTEEAREVFDDMSERNAVAWTAMLTAYSRAGQLDEAMQAFAQMPQRDAASWNAVVAACAENDAVDLASAAFDRMPQRDAIAWNTMIAAIASSGHLQKARELFDSMPQKDTISWNSLLQAQPHDEAKSFFDGMQQKSLVSWNTLLQGYSQHGELQYARDVFDKAPVRDSFTWNAMVQACIVGDRSTEALTLFDSAPQRNVVTWTLVIAVLAQAGEIEGAANAFEAIPQRNAVVWTVLLLAMAQQGRIADSRRLFEAMPERDSWSWNAIVTGYTRNGQLDEARSMFDRMQHRRVESWNAMVQGYAQAAAIDDAKAIFDAMPLRDAISWNSMLAGYGAAGRCRDALQLLVEMDLDGLVPGCVALAAALDACSRCGRLDEGRIVMAELLQWRIELDAVAWTSIISFLGKCGLPDDAAAAFGAIVAADRDAASYAALCTGLVRNGRSGDALALFRRMDLDGVRPDAACYSAALDACGLLAAIADGAAVHGCLDSAEDAVRYKPSCLASLVAMYGRCGKLDEALRLFTAACGSATPLAWSCAVAAAARGSRAAVALRLLQSMLAEGLRPDESLFVCVLSCCGHGGELIEAERCFASITADHGWDQPTPRQVACLVDALARVGDMERAAELAATGGEAAAWTSMLGACHSGGGVEVPAEFAYAAAEQVLRLEPDRSSIYILLSNILLNSNSLD